VSEDWEAINDFFLKKDLLLIKTPIIRKEDLFRTRANINDEDLYQIYLTKKEFSEYIFLKKENDGYGIDILRSYAIEFDRGGFYPYSNKILHRSRFYSVTKFYDENDILVNKHVDFVKWAEELYKTFKRQFLVKSDIDKTFPLSEATVKWAHENNAIMDISGLKIISSLHS
jgi:hypothetical protein